MGNLKITQHHEKISPPFITTPLKPLTYILLFIPFLGLGQQSNAPEIVFPMVEQFIAEAHARKIPTYHKIREIDSIGVESLPEDWNGVHIREKGVDKVRLHDHFWFSRIREKTFLHELGHVWDLPHSDNPKDIMHQGYSNWFNYDKNWQAAKEKFYNDLKNML